MRARMLGVSHSLVPGLTFLFSIWAGCSPACGDKVGNEVLGRLPFQVHPFPLSLCSTPSLRACVRILAVWLVFISVV